MAKKKIEKCSCEEVLHLRKALRKIHKICTTDNGQDLMADVVQISNLADQGLKLEPLVGEPNP